MAQAPVIPLYTEAVPLAPLAPPDDDGTLSTSTRQILVEQGYTNGLCEALEANKVAFSHSFWVVDNSGSMQTNDGQRIVRNKGGQYKKLSCSRWAEMQDTVDYHAQLAALSKTPTTFRLLNDPGRVVGPQVFSIAADGGSSIDQDLTIAQQTMMNAQPGGVTPLARHVQEIRDQVHSMEANLRQMGTKVSVVLATDGTPTDERGNSSDLVKRSFVEAVRLLEGLPVWIVVRLCTNEDAVVDYWSDLDSQLELSLEVLDDFCAEAAEIHSFNPWLTYALPLHRMRELGFYHAVFDAIDERKLSRDEVRDLLKLIFGKGRLSEAPDPEIDWKAFSRLVAELNAKEAKQWNPVMNKMTPWIDMKKLNKLYGPSSFFGLF